MHVTLRRYAEVGARMYEMVFRKVEAGLVPRLKAQPGFRSYCAFVSEDGEGVSVTVFDERGQAARANEQVRGWGQANLRDLLPDRPEVFAGECGIAEVVPRAARGPGPAPHRRGPGVRRPRPGGGDARRCAAARPARHHGLAGVPGRLHVQGRAEAIAGRHRGAVRHPGGREALARAVVAGAPRGGGRRGADPAVGGDGARDRLRHGRLGPGERVRPPHGGPLLNGRRSQRRRRGRPMGMAPPDDVPEARPVARRVFPAKSA